MADFESFLAQRKLSPQDLMKAGSTKDKLPSDMLMSEEEQAKLANVS